MKVSQLALIAATYFASGAVAHSWVECIDTYFTGKDYSERFNALTEWQSKANQFTDGSERCKGYPANLPARNAEGDVASPDWINESSNYSYEFGDKDESGRVYACHKNQRTPSKTGLPAATVTPGQEILIRYWGNGHGTDDVFYQNPQGLDPGVVRIHWKGKKETPIMYQDEINESTWIPGAQQAFEKYAIIDFTNDPVDTLVKVGPHTGEKQKRMKEWALYMKFKVPEEIENGTHNMLWSWAWKQLTTEKGDKSGSTYNKNFQSSYTTCFDLVVKDSKVVDGTTNKAMAEKAASYNPDAELADFCSGKCLRGGMAGMVCDPSKETCPSCYVAPNADQTLPGCYDSCTFGGTMCPSKKAKTLRRRSHKHRRAHF